MFTIPVPTRYRLARPPLAQALVQVRFPLVAQLHRLAGIELVQAHLADLLPYVHRQEVHDVAVTIQPEGEVASEFERTIVWTFEDGEGWTLRLTPASATLSVGGEYRGVEDFAGRFGKVLAALVATKQIRRCERLAVRYLNIVGLPPGREGDYTNWFRPELVGWVGANLLATDATLASSLAQVQIVAAAGDPTVNSPAPIRAGIRSGLIPAGTEIPMAPGHAQRIEETAYVLDHDLFIEANQPFETQALVDQFRYLHAQIDTFFHWSLTEAGAAYFGLEELR